MHSLTSRIPALASAGLLLALAGAPAAQVTVRSNFNGDTDGWTHTGAANFQWITFGGNPGGYLDIDNSEGPITYIYAPAKFLGDLRMFDGGTLSFDGNMLGIGGTPYTSPGQDYGHVQISSPAGVRTVDLLPAPGQPQNGAWTTYSVNFDVATWGGTQPTWLAILSSVTEIRLSVEAMFGAEVQGIDNVELRQRANAASSTLCNGNGTNPVILRNTSSLAGPPAPPYNAPVIGKNWRLELDCNPAGTIGGPAVFRLRFGAKATPVTTAFGQLFVAGTAQQTVLALPADRIAKLGPILIPNTPVLIGSTYVAQGLCPGTPKVLSNALLEVTGD